MRTVSEHSEHLPSFLHPNHSLRSGFQIPRKTPMVICGAVSSPAPVLDMKAVVVEQPLHVCVGLCHAAATRGLPLSVWGQEGLRDSTQKDWLGQRKFDALHSDFSVEKPWKNRSPQKALQLHAEDRSSLKGGDHHAGKMPPGKKLRS